MPSAVSLDGFTDSRVHPEEVQVIPQTAPTDDEVAKVAGMFKLLGDPTRTNLLFTLLEAGELCVHDLAAATSVTESAVSQALRLLRASGVVAGRRDGRHVFYRLSDEHVRLLLRISREHILHSTAAGPDLGLVTA